MRQYDFESLETSADTAEVSVNSAQSDDVILASTAAAKASMSKVTLPLTTATCDCVLLLLRQIFLLLFTCSLH